MAATTKKADFDAVVIGAGFSGLYMLYRLRDLLGMSAKVFEAGDGVGGTWYWNRYPGARCDSEAYMYCFSFDKELMQEWEWSMKYPEQPEILRYLNHVADRFNLRRDIQFNTRVTAAHFNEATNLWDVTTDQGEKVTARYVITGIGCLSAGQVPNIKGRETFAGESYHTGSWPHEGVDLTGKRVGVIGTGSSAVQAIPVIAKQAGQLFVFQRTPQYTIPARHGNVDKAVFDEIKTRYDEVYEKARWSAGGFPIDALERSALDASPEERLAVYEAGWEQGGFQFFYGSFGDIATDLRANATASEFIRGKIREIVADPETAEKLVPVDHPFSSKRPSAASPPASRVVTRFIVLMSGVPVATPSGSRSLSIAGPVALTTTRAPISISLPARISRARTPVTRAPAGAVSVTMATAST